MGLSKLLCSLLFLGVLVKGVEEDKFTNSHGPLTFGARLGHLASSKPKNVGLQTEVEEKGHDAEAVESSLTTPISRFQPIRSQRLNRLNRLTTIQIKRDEKIKKKKEPSNSLRNIRRKTNSRRLKKKDDVSDNDGPIDNNSVKRFNVRGRKLDVIDIKTKPALRTVNTPDKNHSKGFVGNFISNDKSLSKSRKSKNVERNTEKRKEKQLVRDIPQLAITEKTTSDASNSDIYQTERRTLIFRTHRKNAEQKEATRKENNAKPKRIPNGNTGSTRGRTGTSTTLKSRSGNIGNPRKVINLNPDEIESKSIIPQEVSFSEVAKGHEDIQNVDLNVMKRKPSKTTEQKEDTRKDNNAKPKRIPNLDTGSTRRRPGTSTILKSRNRNIGNPRKVINLNTEEIESKSIIPQEVLFSEVPKGHEDIQGVDFNVVKRKPGLSLNSQPRNIPLKSESQQMDKKQNMRKSSTARKRKIARISVKQLETELEESITESLPKLMSRTRVSNAVRPATSSHDMIRIRKLKGAKLENMHFDVVEQTKGEQVLKPSSSVRKRINKGRGRIQNLPQKVGMENLKVPLKTESRVPPEDDEVNHVEKSTKQTEIQIDEHLTDLRKISNHKMGTKPSQMSLHVQEDTSILQNEEPRSSGSRLVRPVNGRRNRFRISKDIGPPSTSKMTIKRGRNKSSKESDHEGEDVPRNVIQRRNKPTQIDDTVLEPENPTTETINKAKGRHTVSFNKAREEKLPTAQPQIPSNPTEDDSLNKLHESKTTRSKMKGRQTSRISGNSRGDPSLVQSRETLIYSPRVPQFRKRGNKLRKNSKVESKDMEHHSDLTTTNSRGRNKGLESSLDSERSPEREMEHVSPPTVNVTLNPNTENENVDYSDYIDIAINHAQITWSQDPFRGSSVAEEKKPLFDIDYSKDPTLVVEEERKTTNIVQGVRKLNSNIFAKNRRGNKARKAKQVISEI